MKKIFAMLLLLTFLITCCDGGNEPAQKTDGGNSKSKLIRLPLPSDDPKQRKPDITKAKTLLNWSPETPLREGLIKTIEYFDDLLKKDPAFVLNP